MKGTIFRDTLTSDWKQILSWGIGMGILGFYIVLIASDANIITQYSNLLSSMPPAMLSAMGISDASLLTTVEGFVSSAYVTYAMILLSVFAVMVGLDVFANEEEDGIMDVLLSLPVSRAQIIIEKTLAHAIITLGIILLSLLFTLAGIMITGADVNLSKVTISILALYPGILLISAVTSLISTIVRRRTTTIGLSTVFIIGSYFANFLGDSASASFAKFIQQLSVFYYTDGEAIILDTFNPLTSVALLAVALVCIGLSVSMFNRRDIGL